MQFTTIATLIVGASFVLAAPAPEAEPAAAPEASYNEGVNSGGSGYYGGEGYRGGTLSPLKLCMHRIED